MPAKATPGSARMKTTITQSRGERERGSHGDMEIENLMERVSLMERENLMEMKSLSWRLYLGDRESHGNRESP